MGERGGEGGGGREGGREEGRREKVGGGGLINDVESPDTFCVHAVPFLSVIVIISNCIPGLYKESIIPS